MEMLWYVVAVLTATFVTSLTDCSMTDT